MSTEGVKLSGAAAGGATVNGSTLWRFWINRSRRCNIYVSYAYINLSGKRTEKA